MNAGSGEPVPQGFGQRLERLERLLSSRSAEGLGRLDRIEALEQDVRRLEQGLGRGPQGLGQEPKPEFIQEIAAVDPIAAYGIVLGVPRIPIAFNAQGTFNSFALGQLPLNAALDATIAQRTWIDNIQYDLQQPNVFSGNIFKTLYDANLRFAPGVSVLVTVHSGPKYLVAPNFTPLNNLVNLLASRWPAGWPLFKQQSILVQMQLTQAPPGTGGNGPPYVVTITFNGWQFLDHTVDEIAVDVAACELRKMGFWVPPPLET
jgi:hypothetical protein